MICLETASHIHNHQRKLQALGLMNSHKLQSITWHTRHDVFIYINLILSDRHQCIAD